MVELVEPRLRKALSGELARQHRGHAGASSPRPCPGAPARRRDEIAEREGKPRGAVVVRVPFDVGVIVAVPKIDVHMDVAHDVGEAQLADRFAEHRLGRLQEREIGRVPPHAETLPAVRVVKGSHAGPHFPATVTTKMWNAIKPTRSAIGWSPMMPRLVFTGVRAAAAPPGKGRTEEAGPMVSDIAALPPGKEKDESGWALAVSGRLNPGGSFEGIGWFAGGVPPLGSAGSSGFVSIVSSSPPAPGSGWSLEASIT